MVDEALLELLHITVPWVPLVEKLNVLPTAYLALLCDALIADEVPHLVIVDIAVVFTSFADDCFDIIVGLLQEHFLNLKHFLLHTLGDLYVEIIGLHDKQKLFVVRLK